MTLDSTQNATLLAATEVVPADWRDLADLLEKNGSPLALLGGVAAGRGRDSQLLDYIRSSIDPARVEYWRSVLGHLMQAAPDIRMVTVESDAYPAVLRKAYGRPPFLFVRGTLEADNHRAIAIVGSRSATPENLSVARALGRRAASSGITVVSGMASGIDSAAHQGALEGDGSTVAVIAAGIDQTVPGGDTGFLSRLLERGAVVSQFRPTSPPARSSFLQRNGVISGLSAVSVIVEGGERSGTRNEADHAMQQGRLVLLWEPAFRAQKWAQLFALNPAVRMVSSIDEVMEHVHEQVAELQACE
jgi:DNA processing protein